MTDTRRYLTEEERAVFEKARRKSGEKVPQNYEGDHYDTIAASLITQWGEGLRGYQAANLQQIIADCIRGEQDAAIQCAAELIAAKDKEIARLREAAEPFTFSTYPDNFQSDDGGCTEAIICDEDVQKLRAALSGKELENE